MTRHPDDAVIDPDRYYTRREVAAMFRVSPSTVARWAVPQERIGYRTVRIAGAALLAFLARSRGAA